MNLKKADELRRQIFEWKSMQIKALNEGNLVLKHQAVEFRKKIEKKFTISTAEIISIAYDEKIPEWKEEGEDEQ